MIGLSLGLQLSLVALSVRHSVCRQIATFNGTTQHITIPTVTLSGDFDFSVTIDDIDTATAGVMLGHPTDLTDLLYFSGTTLVFRINLVETLAPAVLALNTEYVIRGVRVAGAITITLNGVPVISTTNSTDYTIGLVGKRTIGTFLKGKIKNLLFPTAASPRSYPIDDGFSNDPTIRDIASGQDGTAVLFTAGVWAEECS